MTSRKRAIVAGFTALGWPLLIAKIVADVSLYGVSFLVQKRLFRTSKDLPDRLPLLGLEPVLGATARPVAAEREVGARYVARGEDVA